MKNNYRKSKIYEKGCLMIIFYLFSFLMLTSCEQNEPEGNGTLGAPETQNLKKMGDITLQKNVIILNEESISAISSTDNHKIIFSRSSPQTDSIHTGSIITGTQLEGDQVHTILAKVTSVSKVQNQIFVQTESAKLEEFIYSGTISGTYDPAENKPININGKMANYVPLQGFTTPNLVTGIENLERKSSDASQKLIEFNRFNFDKTIPLPTQQAGPVSVASNVHIKGGFTPKIDYKIDFSFGRLTNFEVNFIMDEIALQTFANIQGSLGYTVSVTDYLNIPIAPIVLGPTGLILSPTVSAGPYVGIAATGKAQIKLLDITGNANILVGRNPSMNVSLKKEDDLRITNLEGNVNAEAGVEAKGAVGLMFITVPLANSGLKGRVSAVPSVGVVLIPERKGVIDLKARIQANLFYGFGVNPFRYEGTFPLIQKEYPIYHRDFYF
ncbi:hypothetical protein [Chryseobacterium sp.]|uniref:hypothetical protein n=1 Tax=Chryseobacterium sp. TaxID=1871047 RepID=UPI0025C05C1F|nr:hypothetical protein [Chryseobacterium sp.]